MTDLAYKRVILKLSGSILKGEMDSGIDFNYVGTLADEIAEAYAQSIELCIVVGGGNLVRGSDAEKLGYERITADNMGMLSTVINALSLQTALEQRDVPTRVMSAISIQEMVEPFIRRRAIRHLEKGRVIISSAGTGNPLFTTDTAAALRASQINADIILKGTRVDGVFSGDPEKDADAVQYTNIDYMKVVREGLKVMDLTAITFCRDFNIPIHVFNLNKRGNLIKILRNENIGTKVEG